MAAEQMKNMSPQEMENIQRQAAGGGGGGVMPSPAARNPNPNSNDPKFTQEQLQSQAKQMSSMSPEQLKQQAQMIRSMDADSIRRMNPQMANMTDAQIKMAADQMESMAQNPDMLKMAAEQMKNMSPEDIQNLSKMNNDFASTDNNGNSSANVADAMANMDPKQVKSMMQMLKKNPSLMKEMMKSQGANMDEAQMDKAMEMMENLDEKQMEKVMKAMAGFQKVSLPLRNGWKKVNGLCGGHLLKLLIALFFFCMVRLFVPTSNAGIQQNNPLGANPTNINNSMKKNKIPSVEEFEQDEF